MTNTQQWSSTTPGHIFFLLDQSGSMSNSYGAINMSKSRFAADTLNNLIYELILANSNGQTVKDRVYITVIGYGSSADEIRSGSLSDYYNRILRLEPQNPAPNEVQRPLFIDPESNGLTAMGDAFEMAKDKIELWMNANPAYPAPVVINISDGMPEPPAQRDSAETAANEIMNLNYAEGSPLLFNAHIGEGTAFLFPTTDNGLNSQTEFLYKISSVVPESYRQAALSLNFTLGNNARGLISNADGNALVRFVNFGSSRSR